MPEYLIVVKKVIKYGTKYFKIQSAVLYHISWYRNIQFCWYVYPEKTQAYALL